MIPEFDKNALFIWATYGLGTLMIVATIILANLKARAAQKALIRVKATKK